MPDVKDDKLLVSHINIRPSISILVMQLITVCLLPIIILIGLLTSMTLYLPSLDSIEKYFIILATIMLMGIGQIYMILYAVLVWLNEYYELSPQAIVHKKGVMFRKESKYPLKNIYFVQIQQDLLGRMFNYGTITLLDQRRNKFLDMYLIHNPVRYYQIMDRLNPQINEEGDFLRDKLIDTPRDD